MKVKLGDIVEIDGIRMTCTCRKEFFTGWQHHFMYFSCGELREYQFWEDELDALDAKYIGNKFKEKEKDQQWDSTTTSATRAGTTTRSP